MRAVIMAGGAGSRGMPYTEHVPKAMFPVRGRPLVRRVADHLAASRAVDRITVLCDLAGQGGQVANYLGARAGGKPVSYVQDSGSGTGGDLLHLSGELRGGGPFALWFVDNLCAVDVGEMAARMAADGSEACVAVRSSRREETGFAEVSGGMVARFVEKPVLRLPMRECLGVYVLSEQVLRRVRAASRARGGGPVNLSYDVLEGMAGGGRVSAHDIGGAPWVDVASPAALERGAAEVGRIVRAMGRTGAAGSASRRRLSRRRARG